MTIDDNNNTTKINSLLELQADLHTRVHWPAVETQQSHAIPIVTQKILRLDVPDLPNFHTLRCHARNGDDHPVVFVVELDESFFLRKLTTRTGATPACCAPAGRSARTCSRAF